MWDILYLQLQHGIVEGSERSYQFVSSTHMPSDIIHIRGMFNILIISASIKTKSKVSRGHI